jgi:hypothetical protein
LKYYYLENIREILETTRYPGIAGYSAPEEIQGLFFMKFALDKDIIQVYVSV